MIESFASLRAVDTCPAALRVGWESDTDGVQASARPSRESAIANCESAFVARS